MKTTASGNVIQQLHFNVLLVIFVLGAISGCSKVSDIGNPAEKQYDPILYTDVNPDVTVSYDDIHFVSSFSIDLDHDSVMDFDFKGIKGTSNHPVYGQMTFWEYTCDPRNMNKVSSPDGISQPGSALLYKPGKTFDSSFSWREPFWFILNVPFAAYYYCESDTSGYIGMMVVKNKRKYYGWVLLDWNRTTLRLKVKSYAIRKDPDLAIKAGEH